MPSLGCNGLHIRLPHAETKRAEETAKKTLDELQLEADEVTWPATGSIPALTNMAIHT